MIPDITVRVFVNICVQCMVRLDYRDTIDNLSVTSIPIHSVQVLMDDLKRTCRNQKIQEKEQDVLAQLFQWANAIH